MLLAKNKVNIHGHEELEKRISDRSFGGSSKLAAALLVISREGIGRLEGWR